MSTPANSVLSKKKVWKNLTETR